MRTVIVPAGVLAAWLILAAFPWHVHAAEEEAGAAPPRLSLPSLTSSGRGLLADQMMMMATESFHLAGSESDWPLDRATALVDLALTLIGNNPEIWRNRLSLAQAAGDEEMVTRSLERILRLTPEDDVARLRFIERQLSSIQTLDGKLEAVDAIMNSPDARFHSEALKSRLHSFVARAHLEMGEQSEMVRHLSRAVKLDSTNKDAATMLLELVLAESPSNPARVGMAACGVLMADPLDIRARRILADVFFEQGAYGPALSHYGVINWLLEEQPDDQFIYRYAMSLAARGDQRSAVSVIGAYQAMLWERIAPAEAVGQEAAPATARLLPLDLQLLRVVLLAKAGSSDRALSFFGALRRELESKLPSEEAELELAWIAALCDLELPDGEELFERLEARIDADDPMWKRITGWRLLSQARYAEARAILQPMVRTDLFARLGTARAMKEEGRSNQTITTLLRTVTTDGSGTMAGMLAADDLRDYPIAPPYPRIASHLQAVVSSWPRFFLDPSRSDASLSELSVRTPEATQTPYLEPLTAYVSIRNPHNLPLSLGSGGVVNSTIIVFINARSEGRAIPPPSPIVVDVGRRLRLMPGESVEVPVRLDWTVLGSVLGLSPSIPLSYSLRVIHAPVMTPEGRYVPDRFGQVGNVFVRVRRPMPINATTLEASIQSLTREEEGVKFLGLALMGRSISRLQDQVTGLTEARERTTDIDEREEIDDALAAPHPPLAPVAPAHYTPIPPPAPP
ncbi:MAG: hypothetical protein JJU36_09285, partial [Phycisphaeraceae bacterium]|nr:hypothetical protein [Phycisphaeraceae bacterium]